MSRSQRWLAFARTTRGQAWIIAATYVGACALAIVMVSLRSTWFDATVLEKFPDARRMPEVDGWRRLARDVGAGRQPPDSLAPLSELAQISVYGVLLDEPESDPAERLLSAFRDERPELLLARLRQTLAAGNRSQRLRALKFLETMPALKFVSEGRALSGYALVRARRLGEPEVAAVAERVLRHFESHLPHQDQRHERR
jgi:hypothetical protein